MCHTAVVTVFVLLWTNRAMSEHTVVAVVQAGDSIVLNCTESTTNWHFTPLKHTGRNGGDKDIYTGDEDLSRGVDRKVFRLIGNRTVKEVNLIITSVTFEWAGEYSCSKNSKKFINYKLIVLACRATAVSDDRVVPCTRSKTQHDCNGSCRSIQNDSHRGPEANNEFIGPNACGIPQDQILVSCSVTYFSKDTPVLELRNLRDNKIIDIIDDMSCNTAELNANKGHGRLTCNATLNATMDLDGTKFIWQTSQSTQTQYSCTTQPIKILYSIDGTSADHQTVQLNDTLICTANCSHPCSYKWTWSEKSGQGVYKYEECTNELIANHPGFYRCEAVCRMGKHLCEVTVKNVEVSSPTVSEQVGDQPNSGSKASVSIATEIADLLQDFWHKLI